MAVARYIFCLDPVEDAELIRWLESLPRGTRSRTIVIALRYYRERPTHQELDAKLDRLLETMRKVKSIPITTHPESEPAEPVEARRGLEKMKDRFRSG